MEVIPLIREVRVSDYRSAVRAIKRGAARIELNAALSVGGLTPSWANIRQTIAFAHAQSVPVIVTVCPRSGSFLFCRRISNYPARYTHDCPARG